MHESVQMSFISNIRFFNRKIIDNLAKLCDTMKKHSIQNKGDMDGEKLTYLSAQDPQLGKLIQYFRRVKI